MTGRSRRTSRTKGPATKRERRPVYRSRAQLQPSRRRTIQAKARKKPSAPTVGPAHRAWRSGQTTKHHQKPEEQEESIMKIQTNIKAGGFSSNHNQSLSKKACGLSVKSAVKAGGLNGFNHNQSLLREIA